MSYYILDEAGFVTGTYSGPSTPANSTNIPPPDDAAQPLQFVNGAWKATPAASGNKFITLLAFYSRFTQTERLLIRAAQTRDPVTADFMMLVGAASYIDLASDEAQNGIAYMASTHLISVERAAEIIGAPIAENERP